MAGINQELWDRQNTKAAKLASNNSCTLDSDDDTAISFGMSRYRDGRYPAEHLTDDAKLAYAFQDVINRVRYEEQEKFAAAIVGGLKVVFGEEMCRLVARKMSDDDSD